MDTPHLQATPSVGDGRAARAHPVTAVAPVYFHGGKRLTNLLNWSLLVTLPNSSGTVQYVDSPTTSQKFYKATQ